MQSRLRQWRELVWDVAIIVLGVLIALFADQVVQSIDWKRRAAATGEVINLQLARNAGVYDERVILQPCADKRLEELDQLLAKARTTQTIPDIHNIGRPPFRPTVRSAWEEAVGSEVLAHFDRGRREGLSLHYSQSNDYDFQIKNELLLWSKLHLLENAAGPISETTLTEAATTVAQLRFLSKLNGLNSDQLLGSTKALGIQPGYYIVLDREGSREEIVAGMVRRPICKSISRQATA